MTILCSSAQGPQQGGLDGEEHQARGEYRGGDEDR